MVRRLNLNSEEEDPVSTAPEKKQRRLCLFTAVTWTIAAAIYLFVAIVRALTPLQTIVLILFVLCAILWWYRYIKMKPSENDAGGNNHE